MSIAPDPAHRTAGTDAERATLRDGSPVWIRTLRPDDEPTLRSLLDELPEEDRYLRFFTGGANLTTQAHAAMRARGDDGLGLVALAGTPARVVGHAEYVRDGAAHAEVAFEVAPAWRRQGIATLLLDRLAATAAARGITVLGATVLPSNARMIEVLRDTSLPGTVHGEPGTLLYELRTSPVVVES